MTGTRRPRGSGRGLPRVVPVVLVCTRCSPARPAPVETCDGRALCSPTLLVFDRDITPKYPKGQCRNRYVGTMQTSTRGPTQPSPSPAPSRGHTSLFGQRRRDVSSTRSPEEEPVRDGEERTCCGGYLSQRHTIPGARGLGAAALQRHHLPVTITLQQHTLQAPWRRCKGARVCGGELLRLQHRAWRVRLDGADRNADGGGAARATPPWTSPEPAGHDGVLYVNQPRRRSQGRVPDTSTDMHNVRVACVCVLDGMLLLLFRRYQSIIHLTRPDLRTRPVADGLFCDAVGESKDVSIVPKIVQSHMNATPPPVYRKRTPYFGTRFSAGRPTDLAADVYGTTPVTVAPGTADSNTLPRPHPDPEADLATRCADVVATAVGAASFSRLHLLPLLRRPPAITRCLPKLIALATRVDLPPARPATRPISYSANNVRAAPWTPWRTQVAIDNFKIPSVTSVDAAHSS
ncbi:unnamed protein product [Boreogadus saida]